MTTVEWRKRQQCRLDEANRVRSGRARLRRAVRAGRVTVPVLLLDPPILIHGLCVASLLTWAPSRIGAERAKRLLRGVPPHDFEGVRVGSINLATRTAIAEAFNEREAERIRRGAERR